MAQETAVNVTQALLLVKQRRNKFVGIDKLDDYLTGRIYAAIEEIEGKGIRLKDTMRDLLLVVDYTVWSYQNRDSQGPMPEWLKRKIADRWMEKDGEPNDP